MTAHYHKANSSSVRRRALALGLTLLAVLGLNGCTSVDSDMPWNAPPNWQGSPSIPGFRDRGY